MLLPYVVGGNVGSVTVLALVNKHFNFGLSRISYGRRNADSPCLRWGCLLDRFRYWRWLGNGSSSDDYKFCTFIGVNVGLVSQLALVRNQFGIMLLPYVVGGNVGSVTVLALFGVMLIPYVVVDDVESVSETVQVRMIIGVNVGSVSQLALVRNQEPHKVRKTADSLCRRGECWIGNGSSSDDYEFPTFIGVNVGSVSQLALVRNQFGIMLLPYVVGGNVGSVTVLALVNKHFNFGLSRISYGRRNADSPCRRWGCLLDRFRYWRWLGNGSSSDDYEFPTYYGVTMDRFLNWRWLGIRNRIKFGRLLIPYVVGENVGSVSVLALVRKRFKFG
ncbi:hypothetical protein J6590_073461 [Homalodisca vitripennis]|nr:hypothetical protein J6590_073461 [Homalodisca vitripennis]